jgi:anaerobic magnesium-protoporphyrin IX monomethyl ester cyclase
MRVLLLSMPDSFEHTPTLTMRMPNGALASIAGNLDPHHTVADADVVLAQRQVPATVTRLVREHQPEIVGLSVMTFQRSTARRVISLVRSIRPGVLIVVGGYDPSLAPDVYEDPSFGVDVIVRGEGDLTMRELVRAVEAGAGFDGIAGISFRRGAAFVRNPDRHVSHLDAEVLPPRRSARVLSGYTFLGRPIDVVETSRGCTYDCSFCSIIEMRGRNFHVWPIARVIDDIRDARSRGARAVFIVDDNITLNVTRFKALCEAIIAADLADIHYIVQGMTSAIASAGDELAAIMRRAGFRYIFLGIENVLDADLAFLRAAAKNASRKDGRTVGSATMRAIDVIHRHGMAVVGGLIVGNPDDTPDSIEANLTFARQHVDWPYIQHPTPYPGTPMTKDFRERSLVVNDNVDEYDGTTAVVRSASMSADDIEFLRWRAERWMKLRHLPSVMLRYPGFVARHWPAMLRHTFRGSSWRTWMGLESEREAFHRYKEIRRREREFFPPPSRQDTPPSSFTWRRSWS